MMASPPEPCRLCFRAALRKLAAMPVSRLLLWTDTPGPYLDAIAAAGLTARVAVEALPRKEMPTQAQRADTAAMLAWGAPPGLLPQMPKLRWVQALTAGVEGWL